MRTLQDALIKYSESVLKANEDWYKWKNIDLAMLSCGIAIILPKVSATKKNIFLKHALNGEYLKANDNEKVEIICYYISVWGGIRGNKSNTLNLYALDKIEDIISRGKYGIASWSKALCIRDPKKYAIYDSRVAVALNALQIKAKIRNPTLFPLVPGRGKGIEESIPLIKQRAIDEGWPKQTTSDFYEKFNLLICNAAKALKVEHAVVEMLLFSKAMELVQEAFPGKEFK